MKTLTMLLCALLVAGTMIAQDGATEAKETAAGLYNDGLTSLKAKEYANAYDLLMKSMEVADPTEDADVLRLARANFVIAAYYAGTADSKGGQHDAALAKFEKGLEIDSTSYTNYSGKAKTLSEKGMKLDAINAYFVAADLATAVGKEDRAKSYAKRASAIVSKLYTGKKYDDAIAGAEAYLASGNDSENIRYYLAKSLVKNGKASDALVHAEKAMELGGDASEGKFIYTYAEIMEAAGKKDAAKAIYAKVPPGKYHESAQYKAKEGN